jgi:putative ABC transport system substrate-binding protein
MRMKRRDFITMLGAAAGAWPLAAAGQDARRIKRIGFLAGGARPSQLGASVYGAFLGGMREHGYVEGRDFAMEWRFAEARFELFPELAAELVRSNVDVIVLGASDAVPATQRATATIPIVMGAATDPVGQRYVGSLARPGGNITGLANSTDDSLPKQLEMLLMVARDAARIGFAMHSALPASHLAILKIVQASATMINRTIVPVEVQTQDDVMAAFATLGRERADALIVPANAFFFTQRQRIAELALRARLPTMFAQREYVEAGGLMSYGESLADFYRRAAWYVDKILKGTKPADLPVQQPTRFFLTINLRTAKTLGLTVPPTLLAIADEVID